MIDFGNIKKLDVAGKTADFTLEDVDGEPSLKLKVATGSNKPLLNAMLKQVGGNKRKYKKKNITADMADENRNDDKKLYVDHVIVGWESLVDAKGNTVKFSKDNCVAFIDALPDWMFDKIREFATDDSNFLEVIDVEETAKN